MDSFNNKSKLSQISQFIGILDTAHNRAYNANKFNYVKPLIENIYDSKSYFNAEKLRHPLIEQINNKCNVKSNSVKPLYHEVLNLLKYFDNIDFNHIYRKHNLYADSLANHALIEYFNNSKS